MSQPSLQDRQSAACSLVVFAWFDGPSAVAGTFPLMSCHPLNSRNTLGHGSNEFIISVPKRNAPPYSFRTPSALVGQRCVGCQCGKASAIAPFVNKFPWPTRISVLRLKYNLPLPYLARESQLECLSHTLMIHGFRKAT